MPTKSSSPLSVKKVTRRPKSLKTRPRSTVSPGSISRRCCRSTTAISQPPPVPWGCTGAPCSANCRSGRYDADIYVDGPSGLLGGPTQINVPARAANRTSGVRGEISHHGGHLGRIDEAFDGGTLEHDLLDHV